MTYSILALDPEAGQIGVAVQSHYFGVGSLVPWARPGVGVVATQSVVRAEYGRDLLDELAAGRDPQQALDELVAADDGEAVRQVAVLRIDGVGATHTGSGCIASAGHAVGSLARGQANLVAGPAVWEGMLDVFENSAGTLASRMLDALDAAQDAGGDLRGQQAAALKIVSTTDTSDLGADTVLDLRVDDHPAPLAELRRLASAATALSGLVAMLEHPGLLIGDATAAEDAVANAVGELERAQRILGDANLEPTVWRGLILARFGDRTGAANALSAAASHDPAVTQLLASLAGAGMWQSPMDDLLALTERP
ncbi:DUF1028 domain-containing protein [Microbacterium koreense]|uniref:DUF1028 domain-containing protein n=1 Tax=Microbacterium koreense TaxID=323761 RepID=A0ABW2ZNI7_9MICO